MNISPPLRGLCKFFLLFYPISRLDLQFLLPEKQHFFYRERKHLPRPRYRKNTGSGQLFLIFRAKFPQNLAISEVKLLQIWNFFKLFFYRPHSHCIIAVRPIRQAAVVSCCRPELSPSRCDVLPSPRAPARAAPVRLCRPRHTSMSHLHPPSRSLVCRQCSASIHPVCRPYVTGVLEFPPQFPNHLYKQPKTKMTYLKANIHKGVLLR